MQSYQRMDLTDILSLAWFHCCDLKEDDKYYYHPCRMSFLPALLFLLRVYFWSNVIARDNGKIVGFAFLYPKLELGIIVHSNYRRLGIGRSLIAEIDCEGLWLRVYDINTIAIRLYNSCGLVVTGSAGIDSRGRKLLKMEKNV
jgi:ribosomal protein S18 acetylase RimI-like enzyme